MSLSISSVKGYFSVILLSNIIGYLSFLQLTTSIFFSFGPLTITVTFSAFSLLLFVPFEVPSFSAFTVSQVLFFPVSIIYHNQSLFAIGIFAKHDN